MSAAPTSPGPAGPSRLARPYALVGGRTPTGRTAPIEALVTRTAEGERRLASCRFEARDILSWSATPVSVAELAAWLRVPFGVARVLVADLEGAGLVSVRVGAGPGGPDLAVLERVLEGLRAL